MSITETCTDTQEYTSTDTGKHILARPSRPNSGGNSQNHTKITQRPHKDHASGIFAGIPSSIINPLAGTLGTIPEQVPASGPRVSPFWSESFHLLVRGFPGSTHPEMLRSLQMKGVHV
jgi:hypothetical protein